MADLIGCPAGEDPANEGNPLVAAAGAEGADDCPKRAADRGAEKGDPDAEVCLEEGSPLEDAWKVYHVLRKVWFLAALAGMFHVFMMLEVHFYLPYLYTRVHCCGDGQDLDSHYDITDERQVARVLGEARLHGLQAELTPLAGGRGLRACGVPRFPAGSKLWSLSPHCANRAYVQDRAQRIMALMKPIQKAAGLLVLPVGGTVADSIGRRPVLAFYTVLLLVASGLSAADCWVLASLGDAPVYLAGMLLTVSFTPKDTIISSGIADVMGREEEGKSRAFASLTAMQTSMSLVCIIASYHFIRMHLTSYFLPWLGFMGLGTAMLCLLILVAPETLPAQLRQPLAAVMLDPVQTQLQGMRLLARDPVLVNLSVAVFFFWAYFLGFVTTKVSYLIMVGFTIEETMLPEIVATCFGIVFSALLLALLPRLGPLHSIVLGHALFVVSFVFWGPLTVLYGHVAAYAANVLQTAALLVLTASVPALVSQRVEGCNQAKCQSALSALGSVGAIVSVPIYNHVLFSATAWGLARAQPAVASMLLAMICLGISFRITLLARTCAPAAGAAPAPPAELAELAELPMVAAGKDGLPCA